MVLNVRFVLCLALVHLIPVTALAQTVVRYSEGRWFDGSEFQERSMYSVDGVFRTNHDGAVDHTVNLHGAFVVPPFGEAHNHHFADGMDVEAQVQDYLRQGVFYAKNPNNTSTLTKPLRGKVNTAETVDVAYANGGLTATGGHPVQVYEKIAGHIQVNGKPMEMDGDAYFTVDSVADLDTKWPAILSGKPDFIKVYLEYSEEYETRKNDDSFYGKRGLDPDLVSEVVDRAHAEGLRVSAHVTTAADFRNAVSSGVDEVNHLPLERLTETDAAEAAARQTTVVTTTLSHRPSGHVADLDDVHRHNLRLLGDAGVNLALGTDDGNRTVREEYENLQRLAIFDSAALLGMWTKNTPQTIFPKRKLGRLADGYEASFLALEKNPLEDPTAHRAIVARVKWGRLLDVAPETPKKPSIAEALRTPLMSGSIEDAIATYHRLRRDEPDAYDFSENQLNGLGYGLLNHGQPAMARAILELNCEMFPESANAYDSLAEVLVGLGLTGEAAACYRKVLALLPGSSYDPEFKEHLSKRAKSKLDEMGS